MAEERKFKPLVKLTGLYENVSKKTGDTYFAGFLGNAKVMVLRDKNAEPGKPGWSLCVQEKDVKPEANGGQSLSGYGQQYGQGYPSQGQNQQQGYGQQGKGYGRPPVPNNPPPAHYPPIDSTTYADDVPF
jgi:hypothetical protein